MVPITSPLISLLSKLVNSHGLCIKQSIRPSLHQPLVTVCSLDFDIVSIAILVSEPEVTISRLGGGDWGGYTLLPMMN